MGIPATDDDWMRHAMALAARAETEDDEVPIGAVLVSPRGEILGEGWNRPIAACDPTAHAEIVAIRAAGRQTQNYRFAGCRLYVTLDPCPMCIGAIVHARLERVIIGAPNPQLPSHEAVYRGSNHQVFVDRGILEAETSAQLRDYFKRKRTTPDPTRPE